MKRLLACFGIALLGVTFASVVSATASNAMVPVTIEPHAYDSFPLDLDAGELVESVKTKIETEIGQPPANQCLLYENVLMLDGNTIDEYGIVPAIPEPDYSIDEFDIPVVAGWASTPEEAFLGDAVQNSPMSWPKAQAVTVKSGAFPEGVSLDETSGSVSGTYTAVGPFSVTLELETICGNAEVVWSGDVKERLADTGFDNDALMAFAIMGVLALIGGAVLMLTRKRRAQS
jgi:LPXTG-motif cell wall-anchored protein